VDQGSRPALQAAGGRDPSVRLRPGLQGDWLAHRHHRGGGATERRNRAAQAADGGGPMTELERRLGRPPASAPFDVRAATTVLAQRAVESGLADVAYGWLDSPLGKLIVAVTPRGLVRIAYEREAEEDVLQELAEGVAPGVLGL